MRTRGTRALFSFPLLFALVAAMFVGAFVSVIPVGFGMDEEHQTYRAWQVSRGQWEPDEIVAGVQYGGQVPSALVDYVIEGTDAGNAARVLGQPWVRHDIAGAPDLARFGAVRLGQNSPTQIEEFTNAGAASFLPYLPAAVGMRIGTALQFDVAGIVLAGKAVNGAVYVGLVSLAAFAVRRSRWRWLVATIALLPVSVFQASVITPDTLSNASAILFVAAILALRSKPPSANSKLLLLLAALAGLGVVMAKPTYILLLPLLFTVPHQAMGLRRGWSVFAKLTAVSLLAGWGAYLTSRATDIAGAIRMQVPAWESIDQQKQLALLIADPLSGLAVLVRTLIESGAYWIESSIALVGINIVFVPEPFAVALIIALVLAALRGDERAPMVGTAFIAVAAATATAVVMALYLTYTAVGAPTADGVQGRYWIPLLLPTLAGLAMLVPLRVKMSERAAALTFGAVSVSSLTATLAVWCWTVY